MHLKHVFRENYLSNTALPIGTPNLKRNHILYAEYFEIKLRKKIVFKDNPLGKKLKSFKINIFTMYYCR